MNIVAMPEYEISGNVCSQLQGLLEECFPDTFEGRTYFKQLPHLRLLAMDAGLVVGQVGIDGRVVNVGGTVISIFGRIDLAVHPGSRGRRIGTMLLGHAERFARAWNRDFLVLMADRHDLYLREGYSRVQPAHTRWLAIDNRQSVEVIERDLGNCFMVKSLIDREWPEGTIDMLGYLF